MFDYDDYNPVRSVGERKALAAKLAKQYAGKTGRELHPVTANGRSIAKSFWGKAWCRNIESYQDYESRLPRGRSYLKNGAVIDLNIEPGLVTAMVAGSELYQVKIAIDPLDEERWNAIKRACAGKIGSLIDLVQGKLSDEIIGILCAPDTERTHCD